MISASKFYRPISSKLICAYTTLQQARSHVESVTSPKSIVILLPESTNSDQDSDLEDVSNQLQEENLIFEPTGFLEIDYVKTSSDKDKVQVEAMSSKCQKASIPKLKKTTILIMTYHYNSHLKILQTIIRICHYTHHFVYGKWFSGMRLLKK